MLIVNVVGTLLCILLGVAYVTLLERKLLSYMQTRKGPNKVGISGLMQPFADALKLFLKERFGPLASNIYMYMFFPILGLGLGLLVWGLTPRFTTLSLINYSILLFLCISALNVYVVFGSGWASHSLYAFLGGLRASAQTISYEISLVFILLFPLYTINTMGLSKFLMDYPVFILWVWSLFFWLLSSVAETNRAPFDFAEGESELVSGFNIEYGSGPFALLFLGEYSMILFMSGLSVVLYFGATSTWWLCLGTLMVLSIFLLVRGVYPRLRYDKLMTMCWKSILPLAMCSLSLMYLSFMI
uniref:NADH-ubiquinone oxidoreductase chain 1 n=1 Tax=Fruticicola koreana TaxID=1686014 RepID=A0A3S6GS53_9EUPU|nr:NADH dehydrogenase subunit 1 [Fruticicola koreana]